MGYALLWLEGLAVALLAIALVLAWAARSTRARVPAVAFVCLIFLGAAGTASVATYRVRLSHYPVATTWLAYALSWLTAYILLSGIVLWRGLHRAEAGLRLPAALWPAGTLALGLGVAVVAAGFTWWNLDLASRADLAIARQDAGALLLELEPAAGDEPLNAARLYAQAIPDVKLPIRNPWQDAVRPSRHAQETPDWHHPYIVDLLKEHQKALPLLRKAAAMPHCRFAPQRSLDLRFLASGHPETERLWRAVTLLSFDARIQAIDGHMQGAFDDITAIFGICRQTLGTALGYRAETAAWRTLEDVLRLALPDAKPLPDLSMADLVPLVRKAREEMAILGIVGVAAASQPGLVAAEFYQNSGPLAGLAVETVGLPVARVFVVPDEITAMHMLFDHYRHSPRSATDETPRDWQELRRSLTAEPTSIFSAVFIKPKHEQIVNEMTALAVLRQAARTGLAAAAYERKHGRYPDQLQQLVPEFLANVPLDPRDGQELRIKTRGDAVIICGPQDEPPPETITPHAAPLFRLPVRQPQ
jgi:hypothetical protein